MKVQMINVPPLTPNPHYLCVNADGSWDFPLIQDYITKTGDNNFG